MLQNLKKQQNKQPAETGSPRIREADEWVVWAGCFKILIRFAASNSLRAAKHLGRGCM